MTTAASTVVLGTTGRVGADGFAPMVLDLAELNTSGLFVTGNTGSGKSGALRKFVEETYGRGQQLVLDSEGEFSTLAAAFAFVVLGGRSPSVPPLPTEPAHVRALAEKVYELGVSAIFDMSRLELAAQQAFVRDFVDATLGAAMHLQPEERHFAYLVIDELQLFAPQQSTVASSAKIVDLSNRGRRNGLVPVFATQRLSYVDKGAVAMIQNKLIGKTTYSGDMTRAAEEMPLDRLQRERLRSLERRQFYSYGPALSSEPTQFTVGEVKTHMPRTSDRTTYDPPSPTPEILAALAALGAIEDVAGRQEQQVPATARRGAPKPVSSATGSTVFPAPAAPACGHEAELGQLRRRIVKLEHDLHIKDDALTLALTALMDEQARTKTLRTAIDDAMAAYARGENTDGARQPDGGRREHDALQGRLRADSRLVRSDLRELPGVAAVSFGADATSVAAGDGSPAGRSERDIRLDSDLRAGGPAGVQRAHEGRGRALRQRPAAQLPAPAAVAKSRPSGGRDTEDMKDEEVEALLESKLSARLAGGAAVIVMAPAEMLRHEYQQRAVDLVMEKAKQLGPDAREVMRFMLGHFDDPLKVSMPISQIAAGVSDYRSGRPPERWSNAVKALQDAGFVGVRGRGGSTGYFPRVRDWVRNELGAHDPTIEDVDATYQAVLARIAGGVSA